MEGSLDTGSIPVYSTYNNTADLPQIKLERLIYKGFRLYFFSCNFAVHNKFCHEICHGLRPGKVTNLAAL